MAWACFEDGVLRRIIGDHPRCTPFALLSRAAVRVRLHVLEGSDRRSHVRRSNKNIYCFSWVARRELGAPSSLGCMWTAWARLTNLSPHLVRHNGGQEEWLRALPRRVGRLLGESVVPCSGTIGGCAPCGQQQCHQCLLAEPTRSRRRRRHLIRVPARNPAGRALAGQVSG